MERSAFESDEEESDDVKNQRLIK